MGDELRLLIPKTDESTGRNISLNAQTVAFLRRHRKRQAEQRLALGEAWNISPLTDEHGAPVEDLVVTEADGSPVPPNRASWTFRRLCGQAGLRTFRLHSLRHYHATSLLQRGAPISVVSQRLGHVKTSFTLDTYIRYMPTEQARYVAVVDEALGSVLAGLS